MILFDPCSLRTFFMISIGEAIAKHFYEFRESTLTSNYQGDCVDQRVCVRSFRIGYPPIGRNLRPKSERRRVCKAFTVMTINTIRKRTMGSNVRQQAKNAFVFFSLSPPNPLSQRHQYCAELSISVQKVNPKLRIELH